MFLEGHISLVLFYIELIVAYPLNANKPQLLVTFEIVVDVVFVSKSSLTKAFLK